MHPMTMNSIFVGVRSSAAEILPYLLACARERGKDCRAQMWHIMLPACKEAIEAERNNTCLVAQLQSIAQVS